MGFGIERRLKRDLFAYCILSKEYYEDLDQYVPRSSDFLDAVKRHVPAHWSLKQEKIWYVAIPNAEPMPPQGFKVHCSATCLTALETLHRVLPVCVKEEIPFKVIVDSFMLNFANSKNFNRSSSGKFLTFYPRTTDQMRRMAETVCRETSHLQGPFILSDKPVEKSKVIFYRYGGFTPRWKLNVFGEKVPVIASPSGELVPDPRTPYFQLPPWVVDPFELQQQHEGDILLGGRYRIKGPLQFSNAGGVYQAVDTVTDHNVIVKEARPLVGIVNENSLDAVGNLEKEYRVLKKLEHTGFVPRAIELFRDWEHLFLVEEHVEGTLLSSFRAIDEVGLLLKRTIDDEAVRGFCLKINAIALRLLEAVRAFHREGVIIGDLSPSNIIIDLDTLHIKIIDLEGAYVIGGTDSSFDPTFTAGFVSPKKLAGDTFSFDDDYYSLGCVIYSLILPVQTYFHLNPAALPLFLRQLVDDVGLPSYIREVIVSLLNGNPGKAEELLEWHSTPERVRKEAGVRFDRPSGATLQHCLHGITSHILRTADFKRTDRLWPADYRVFTTNPLNVSYGAMGIALYLQSTLGQLPDQVQSWLLDRPIDTRHYPPGLFVGCAGIAWSFAELGLLKKGEEVMRMSYDSDLRFESPDIFYGAAGWGLASLAFWHQTGNPMYLDKAREAAAFIIDTASSESSGYYWKNIDGVHYYGYAGGGSGIAFFLLHLYLATTDSQYLDYAVGGLDFEIAQGIEKEDYIVWERSKESQLLSPYWRYGNAGIGSVLIRFSAVLDQSRYRELAHKAARYVATKYAVFPGQFLGLSGMGEFLLDMYVFTGDDRYLSDAYKVAEGVLLFQMRRKEEITFPGEELMRFTNDFGTGSAGIGMFFARLLRPRGRLFYDFGDLRKVTDHRFKKTSLNSDVRLAGTSTV